MGGAGGVACHKAAPCETGLPGVCFAGTYACDGSCTPDEDVGAVAEDCATPEDDDCDGDANESDAGCTCVPGETSACAYEGPDGTLDIGVCQAGTHACNTLGTDYEACSGQVTPTDSDICDNGLDDNCDGAVDEGCACDPGDSRACYTGPSSTRMKGICTDGTQGCEEPGNWSATCVDAVLPVAENCSDELDNDCDGSVNEGCPIEGSVVKMVAGMWHTCALLDSGSVVCWGSNDRGQLGTGASTGKAKVPTPIEALGDNVLTLAAGGHSTCAVLTGGELKCWGANKKGQLGDGTIQDHPLPAAVTGLESGVQSVGVGETHACALMQTGGVKCWGINDKGQVGNGLVTDLEKTAVDVYGLTSGVIAISVGFNHSCALLDTGAVKCWGSNSNAQVGVPKGDKLEERKPRDVTSLSSGVVALASGGFHSCVLLDTGGLKCWGSNQDGQFGDGDHSPSEFTPVDVLGLSSGVAGVTAGESYTCAWLNLDGMKCWGANAAGQLGHKITLEKKNPTDVYSTLSEGVIGATAGDAHTCAWFASAVPQCWGSNGDGQLGDGTVAVRNYPADVVGF